MNDNDDDDGGGIAGGEDDGDSMTTMMQVIGRYSVVTTVMMLITVVTMRWGWCRDDGLLIAIGRDSLRIGYLPEPQERKISAVDDGTTES